MLPLLLACATPAPSEEAPAPADETTPDLPEVTETDEDTLDTEPIPDSRPRKVMRIAHLRDAMEQVSGVQWTVSGGSGWDEYAATLGVPDLQTTLEEGRSGASVMLQKFLDDAASATCTDWIEAELDGESATFFVEATPEDTDEAALQANLVHLRWRITGRAKGGSDPIIDDYLALFERVMQRTGDPLSAWNTVCVGLFTHPDFYTY